MPALRIVLLAIGAAIAYGVVHDQVTARVCVEYFTIGHPKVVESEEPALLGLVWGVIATWWMGAILGAVLAVAARAGGRPTRSARDLLGPVALLLGSMAACAVVAGLLGAWLGSSGAVVLLEPLASRVPESRHVRYLAALWAHSASYGVGAIGGLFLAAWVWRGRGAR